MVTPRVDVREWSKTFTEEGEPVLCCSSAVVAVSRLEQRAQRRINRYYERLEQSFQRWCEKRPYQRTAAVWRECRARSRLFEVVELSLGCAVQEITQERLPILLTYTRKTEEKILYSAQQLLYWDVKTGLAELKSS